MGIIMKRRLQMIGIIFGIMTAAYGCSSQEEPQETASMEETLSGETQETAPNETGAEGNGQNANHTDVSDTPEHTTDIVKTGKAIIDIPEDFKEYLSPSGIYVTKKYPEDGSHIYILTTALYGEFPDQKEYTRLINESLSSQTGEKVEIKIEEFGKTTVDGCDALRTMYTYSYDGLKFKRLEYTVNTDITTIIAYTQVDNAKWMEDFEESALSMRIE